MNAVVNWHKGMSFTGKAETGFEVPLGADPAVGGAKDGFEPLELMAVSLAGCTAMDVISILMKKKQDVSAFEVKAVLRAIELSATKYCPAQAMLGKVMPMELVYEIYEDEGEGNKRLAKQGKYQIQGA